jgi:hypothetical protein
VSPQLLLICTHQSLLPYSTISMVQPPRLKPVLKPQWPFTATPSSHSANQIPFAQKMSLASASIPYPNATCQFHTANAFSCRAVVMEPRSPSENCFLKGASATENQIVKTASQSSPHKARGKCL